MRLPASLPIHLLLHSVEFSGWPFELKIEFLDKKFIFFSFRFSDDDEDDDSFNCWLLPFCNVKSQFVWRLRVKTLDWRNAVRVFCFFFFSVFVFCIEFGFSLVSIYRSCSWTLSTTTTTLRSEAFTRTRCATMCALDWWKQNHVQLMQSINESKISSKRIDDDNTTSTTN